MKTSAQPTLRTALAILALSGLSLAAATGTGWYDGLGRLTAIALVVLPLVGVVALLFRRVQSEDRIVRLEAALCRERTARSQADQALAEADLLLARLAANSRTGHPDPASQMYAIQADLAQLQRQVAPEQPLLARRLEGLCRRLERATTCLRNIPNAAEPG